MSPSPLKVGVIGVGHLGKEHARIYHSIPSVSLVGVADISPAQAKTIGDIYTTTATTDYRQLIGHVDAVSVATPTNTHFAICRDFLTAGVHVLVEKPMSSTYAEAVALTEIAKVHNTTLQVGHVERFNPIVMEVLTRNLDPVYIEIFRLSQFRFRSGDVGVVLDLMIHDIDFIRTIVKSDIVAIDAIGVNLLGMHEDIANARITFQNGCVANVTASRASLKSVRHVRMFTRNGYLSLNLKEMKGTMYQTPKNFCLEDLNWQKLPANSVSHPSTFEDLFFGYILQTEHLAPPHHEPLQKELESFVSAIQNRTPPLVTGEDGMEAIRIATQIRNDIHHKLKQAQTHPQKPLPMNTSR